MVTFMRRSHKKITWQNNKFAKRSPFSPKIKRKIAATSQFLQSSTQILAKYCKIPIYKICPEKSLHYYY